MTETKNVFLWFYKALSSFSTWLIGFFTFLVALAHGAAAANRVEVGRRVEQELGRTYEKKGYTARNMARNFRHAIHNSNNNKKDEMLKIDQVGYVRTQIRILFILVLTLLRPQVKVDFSSDSIEFFRAAIWK